MLFPESLYHYRPQNFSLSYWIESLVYGLVIRNSQNKGKSSTNIKLNDTIVVHCSSDKRYSCAITIQQKIFNTCYKTLDTIDDVALQFPKIKTC